MKILTQTDLKQRLDSELFRQLTLTADKLGLDTYLVGGYVRDLFLQRPTNDIDVVVVGSGIALAKAFTRQLGKGASLNVFPHFGTAQVKWKGNEIEFVGARRESYTHDSRKPIVEDGTLEDDQNRRDFTINAMAVCLNADRLGMLTDPFDGLHDLQEGIIRTPCDPDITFSDDPLRMMRCIRFATQLNFAIEEETFQALERNKERIRIISGERIVSELNKIMLSPTPSCGFVNLHRCGLLQLILPELAALDCVETRNGRSHKNNFYHTLEVLDTVSAHSDNLYLRWAALLHDIGKPRSKRWEPGTGWTFHNHNFLGEKMVKPLFRRLKLPLDERMKYVAKLVGLHMRPIAIADDIVTDSAVRRLLFEAGDDIDDLMLLCEADVTSKNAQRKQRFLQNFQLVRRKLMAIEEKDRIRNFQPPVTGDEIMQRFHLTPSPAVGQLKSALKDAILDGLVPNEHDAALDFVIQRARQLGLEPDSEGEVQEQGENTTSSDMHIKTIIPALAMAATSAFAQQNLASGIDKANMNLNAKPGTDFFEYAAGGWNAAHPLTPEFSRYAQFDALAETNRKQLRELIEELARTKHPQGSLEQKIGSLYNLAMDSVRRNEEDYTPIKATLEKVEQINSRKDVQYVMAWLSSCGISNFFGISCDADLKDAGWNLMQVNQGGISMGERDYYLGEDEPTKKVREAYREYVQHLFTMTGKDEATAKKSMEAVLKIETQIATASYSATKLRDVEGNYHKMTYRQLLADYPGIDWSTLMLLNGVPAFENISVNQPEPIHEVEKILADTPLDELKAYLYYKVVDDAASALSDRFRAEAFNFYNRTMGGAEQDRPRWKRAVSSVESTLGMAVGRMYVEKYFPESSKQRMLQLVKNLQAALGQRIDQQAWMSDETKKMAHEKLNAFYVKIGYPDTWMDYSALEINDSLSYYENLVNATKFISNYYVQKRVNKRTDRNEWLMTPQTINAYYNPTTNEICFPAGILQPPFFNAEADDACNYGAIGVVIGHEMTHGFDDQGAQFDKNGNLRNWWTDADKANFKQRTKGMADFFSKIEVLPGMHANGELTLGENIADHGGLNIAFLALQNAMKENPLGTKDGFTPEQRFFLSYGLIWANNIREEMLRQLNKVDPHSPGRWRVNGALPHIDAWYKAFHITKNAPLFIPKKQRVDIW